MRGTARAYFTSGYTIVKTMSCAMTFRKQIDLSPLFLSLTITFSNTSISATNSSVHSGAGLTNVSNIEDGLKEEESALDGGDNSSDIDIPVAE
jgi:hypothetical protein